jgi:uncharacterized repeat protein (TIGR01451 family)
MGCADLLRLHHEYTHLAMKNAYGFRTICAVALVIGGWQVTRAQLVFIPDTNLRQVLNAWALGAVDANGYIDTQHPNVLARHSLNFEVYYDPMDLSGLEALDQLDSLSIQCYIAVDHFNLDSITVTVNSWPANLHYLRLFLGTYPTLPDWPAGLAELDCYLPSGPGTFPALPQTITVLRMVGAEGQILPDLPQGILKADLKGTTTTMIPTLPSTLEDIQLSQFGATSLDPWPMGLTKLSLDRLDHLIALPAFPSTLMDLSIISTSDVPIPTYPSTLARIDLQELSVGSLPAWPNDLVSLRAFLLSSVTSLPPFPSGLDTLQLGFMPLLASLPPFPATIRTLGVSEVPLLSEFPALPDSLHFLFLSFMNVSSLPAFPVMLTGIDLSHMTGLQCLPILPEGLTTLYIDVDGGQFIGTAVACLPNLPPGMMYSREYMWNIPLDPTLLCTVLNSTCEFVNPVATGAVFWDQNTNGTRDGGEPGYPFASVHAQPGNYMFGVQPTGDFNAPLPLDQYTLTASSSNPYVQSIAPASHAAPFVNATDVDAGNDFGVVLIPNMQDLRIDQSWPWGRPGFETTGWITYENIGSLTMDGTITLELDADLAWVGANPAPSSVVGNTITWDYGALQVAEVRNITYTVYTDPGVALGTAVQNTVIIGPVLTDETGLDNSDVATGEVIGSFDPNDKRVEPPLLTPAQVLAGAELEYTIRFQNTGNFPADRVIITDTLSSDIQWNAMRFITSSHPCTWVLLDNGVLRFTFDQILLPDSTSDEPNSHGFVKFAMRPVSTLMVGESVSNVANIYFDYNAPVITNEAVMTVDATAFVEEHAGTEMHVWPNPVSDVLMVALPNGAASTRLEVLDATGRTIMRSQASGQALLNVAELAPGPYVLRCMASAGVYEQRFVKK